MFTETAAPVENKLLLDCPGIAFGDEAGGWVAEGGLPFEGGGRVDSGTFINNGRNGTANVNALNSACALGPRQMFVLGWSRGIHRQREPFLHNYRLLKGNPIAGRRPGRETYVQRKRESRRIRLDYSNEPADGERREKRAKSWIYILFCVVYKIGEARISEFSLAHSLPESTYAAIILIITLQTEK